MTLYSLSAFSILLILLPLSPSPCQAYIDDDFQLGLEMLQYQNVTPAEINAWWEETKRKRLEDNPPRVFPICIAKDPTYGWPDVVANTFEKIFAEVNSIRKFEKNHTWLHKYSPRPQSLVQEINLYSILAQPRGSPSVEMNQWVGIRFKVDNSLKGIYIQSIGGPLGIPVGEFVKNPRCIAGTTIPAKLMPYVHIVPCSFSPRVSETNPNAIIMDYRWYTGSYPRQLIFQFKWSEAQCQEIGYFQFIIIATTDFVSVEHYLSPIYKFSDLVAGTGLPTPHHIEDGMNCKKFGSTPPFTILDDGRSRIMPNKEYDDCILKGTGRETTGIDRDTCPPGHFACKTMWKTKKEYMDFIEKYFERFIKKNDSFQDCCEIGPIKPPPSTTTSTTTTAKPTESGNMSRQEQQLGLAIKQDKYLKKKVQRQEKIHQVTHGDLCILVWLVIIPMSDHISRFLKDLPDFESVGLGFWIIAHMGLHSGGLILVWLSFGLVVGSGDDKLGNVGVRHFLLGFVCTTIQHAQFITGLKRNLRDRESFYYVLSHSLSGYISHFFGLVDVALSNACSERKWLSLGIFLVWLSCTVASFYVEKVQDRRIGMSFHRAQFPVLQRVVMEEGKNPPLMGVKLGILAFMAFAQVGMFTVMMVYYEASATVDKKIQELHNRGRALYLN